MKNLASSKLHPNLVWLSKNFKCNNLHQVSLPISWGKYDQISQSCLKFAKVSYPAHFEAKKKKYFGKIFFRVGFSHEYKHTVKEGSQSSMETEPKHFRAILMRTLALKNLHPLLSQPGYLQEKRREGRRESHLQET